MSRYISINHPLLSLVDDHHAIERVGLQASIKKLYTRRLPSLCFRVINMARPLFKWDADFKLKDNSFKSSFH